MEEAIAGFMEMPRWAQIGVGFFALTFLVMLFGPGFTHRKFRRRFDAIAAELGRQTPKTRGWPVAFAVSAADRPFEIRHDFRSGGSRSSYRGPTGYLLITATKLASPRWAMHQVDVRTLGRVTGWLLRGKRRTDDTSFDARFVVIQDGLHVREGWLDTPTRAAITAFVDGAGIPGVIWIRDGELQYLMQDPWKGIDGPAVRRLLEQQSALANALDRTAAVG